EEVMLGHRQAGVGLVRGVGVAVHDPVVQREGLFRPAGRHQLVGLPVEHGVRMLGGLVTGQERQEQETGGETAHAGNLPITPPFTSGRAEMFPGYCTTIWVMYSARMWAAGRRRFR